jgi:hypothetical protein
MPFLNIRPLYSLAIGYTKTYWKNMNQCNIGYITEIGYIYEWFQIYLYIHYNIYIKY